MRLLLDFIFVLYLTVNIVYINVIINEYFGRSSVLLGFLFLTGRHGFLVCLNGCFFLLLEQNILIRNLI